MCAFVVLGFVFPYQAKRLAWGTLQNDLFCVEWDVKPQLSQSSNRIIALLVVMIINCHLLWCNFLYHSTAVTHIVVVM